MAKTFFELVDKGTTFFDMSNGQGIVANRVEPLVVTAIVQKAEQENRIRRLSVVDGKSRYAQQKADEIDLKKKEAAALGLVYTEPTEEVEEEDSEEEEAPPSEAKTTTKKK